MKKTWLILLFLVVSLSGGSLGHAATITQLDLKQMADQASTIFLGICNSSTSRWDAGRRMIFTDSTFLVKEYVKGNLGPVVTITEPGGVLPELNMAMIVTHLPRFHEGEEVVLFIWTDPQGMHRVVAGLQGKLSVRIDPATGAKMVQGAPLEELLSRIESRIKDK